MLPQEFVDLLCIALKPGVDYLACGGFVVAPERVPSGNPNTQQDDGINKWPQLNWQEEGIGSAKKRCIEWSHPVGTSLLSRKVDLLGSHGTTAAVIQQGVLQSLPVKQEQVQIQQIPSPDGIQKAWHDTKGEQWEILYGSESKKVTFAPDVNFECEREVPWSTKGQQLSDTLPFQLIYFQIQRVSHTLSTHFENSNTTGIP